MPVSIIENASFGNNSIVTANGIKFPATQVASADANTLDDYEEGTWTPTLNFGGASGVTNYALRNGTYTKIGNTVSIRGYISITTKSSATGEATLTGLPFTTRGINTEYSSAYIYMASNNYTGAPTCYIAGSSTSANLGQTNGTTGFTSFSHNNFVNGGDMIFQATYQTA